LKISDADRKTATTLTAWIKAAAKRQAIDLPDGWKASVAIHLVSSWAEKKTTLPEAVLDAAAALFAQIEARLGGREAGAPPAFSK
jgi:hypothetical protein